MSAHNGMRGMAMAGSIFSLIRTRYNTLSASQKRVADYILNNSEKTVYSSLNTLAAAAEVSETTIIRFLRKINYQSYQVFRVHIAQELSHGNIAEDLYSEINKDDDTQAIISKVMQSTIKALQDSEQAIDAVQMQGMLDAITNAGKILVIGVGASSAIAFDLYHKLLKLGYDSSITSDTHMMNIAASNLQEGDFLICVSHSGESVEILNALQFAKSRVKIAAITSYENSSLSLDSDYRLISSSLETLYRSDSLTSRIIQLTFVDMIYVSLALRLGDEGLRNIERSRLAVAKNKR